VTALWLVVGTMALLYLTACRQGVPAIDLGPKPPYARGTIAGLVHGPGDVALPGRTVELVNISTGDKHTTTTVANGGFSIELPKGKYRLQLQLQEGETLVKQPGVVDLDRGDIDTHIEFVVTTARAAHHSSYRLDNGLGSPIA
jgi:hypothetical protein